MPPDIAAVVQDNHRCGAALGHRPDCVAAVALEQSFSVLDVAASAHHFNFFGRNSGSPVVWPAPSSESAKEEPASTT